MMMAVILAIQSLEMDSRTYQIQLHSCYSNLKMMTSNYCQMFFEYSKLKMQKDLLIFYLSTTTDHYIY